MHVARLYLLGAGSLVTQGQVIPPNVLAVGRPAQVIRPLTKAEIAKNQANIQHYLEMGKRHAAGDFPQIQE